MAYFRSYRRSYGYSRKTNQPVQEQSGESAEYVTEIPADIKQRIEAILTKVSFLNQREKEFCESINSFYSKKGYITSGQYNWFAKIEKNYSDDKIKESQAFADTFRASPEMKKKFDIACQYYRSIYLFMDVVSSYESDANFVPSGNIYAKMTENYYIRKIYAGIESAPKYENGALVKIDSLNYRRGKSISGEKEFGFYHTDMGVVLESNVGMPGNAVNGNKIYKVLCLKSQKIFLCEERYAKRIKK